MPNSPRRSASSVSNSIDGPREQRDPLAPGVLEQVARELAAQLALVALELLAILRGEPDDVLVGRVGARQRGDLVLLHLAGELARDLDRPDLGLEGARERAFDEAGELRFEIASARSCVPRSMRTQVPRSCRGPISIPRRGCPLRALPQPGRAAWRRSRRSPSDAVAAARPADQTVAPTMSAGSERPRTSHGITTAAAAHSAACTSAPEVTIGRTTSLAVRLAAPSKRGRSGSRRAPNSRLWPSSGSASSSHHAPTAPSAPRVQALRAVPARAGKAPASPTMPSSGRERGRRPGERRRRAAASGGSATARKTSRAAPTRGVGAERHRGERRGGGQQPAAARHERDEDRRPEAGADGGQRGVGQQARRARAPPAGPVPTAAAARALQDGSS